MLRESLLDKILYQIKKLIPGFIFNFFAPVYHTILAYVGAILYGFPSRSMKVIGVTGTKGKSTTVFLISTILEKAIQRGYFDQAEGDLAGGVAAIGSLGFKIKDKEWPNNLKMTMPGRFRLQKFLAEAKKAGCKYVVLEVTSEGIKQKRHIGINFDCAVFTNIHKEHLESHGSFENYIKAKQELFKKTDNIQVINSDDPNFEQFSKFHSNKTIFYGLKTGDIIAQNINSGADGSSFEIYGTVFNINLGGEFNILNSMAALAVGVMYGLDLPQMKPILESVQSLPGRMEWIQKEPFGVVVDYAHTPDSLELVYGVLKKQLSGRGKLICVLGSAGGGRDRWKRPEFGRIAGEYCDEIILTNEDPYDENPEAILDEIASGFSQAPNYKSQITNNDQSPNVKKYKKILDRREALKVALTDARAGDIIIITGKGSETSIAVAGGKKIPWSDRDVVRKSLNK